MARRKKGEGRGLDYFEVALIKRMILEDFPRDRIMSFFIRPGRVISPAAKSEVEQGRIGRDVEPASIEELQRFVTARLNEVRPISDRVYGGPLSPSRVREVLSLARDAQTSLPGFESQIAEYKELLPKDRAARIKIAKTAASFANSRGGYLFFGVTDAREIVGIDPSTCDDKVWHAISQCLSECFSPSFRWEHALLTAGSATIAAMYVYEAELKPIICTREYAEEIHKGHIYARYAAMTKLIEPGDLIAMLGDRDRQVVARTIKDGGPARGG